MKCAKCPLFHSWNTESESNEVCGLFGDTWDSPFQYEDSSGCIVGCYIDSHFIDKVNVEFEKHLADECASWEAWMQKIDVTS